MLPYMYLSSLIKKHANHEGSHQDFMRLFETSVLFLALNASDVVHYLCVQ